MIRVQNIGIGAMILWISCVGCATPFNTKSDQTLAELAGQGLTFASEARLPKPESTRAAAISAGRPVSAAWWGFDPDDATDALQASIESGAAVVRIPDMGTAWNITTIELRSNLRIEFERGVVLQAKRGEFRSVAGAELLRGKDIEHIELSGYGATLRMWREDYVGPDYELSEWRHALALRGTRDALIAGLRIENSGGDGIYLGRGSQRISNQRIHIRDVVAIDNHRQGISVISADGLLIEDSWLVNTAGTAPQAGIDFEPNKPDEQLTNCVVRNVRLVGNAGWGMLVSLQNLRRDSKPVNITLQDSLIAGNGIFGVFVYALYGVDGHIKLLNNQRRDAIWLVHGPQLEITR